MDLLDIIKATLVELDRGTDADTIAMYAEKFTRFANEGVNEIARRLKICLMDYFEVQPGPPGKGVDNIVSLEDFNGYIKRVTHVWPAEASTDGDDNTIYIVDYDKPLYYRQPIHGAPFLTVRGAKPGGYVAIEFLYTPQPMSAESLSPDYLGGPNSPMLPEAYHHLIPIYVRARELAGQDPATQGTSSAFFSLFNQMVYNLQRETMATPESFQFKNYHFE